MRLTSASKLWLSGPILSSSRAKAALAGQLGEMRSASSEPPHDRPARHEPGDAGQAAAAGEQAGGDAVMGGHAWTDEELSTLAELWPWADKVDLCRGLPRRRWAAICRQAAVRGLRRVRRRNMDAYDAAHPIFVQLMRLREKRRLTRPQLAEKIGYHPMVLAQWERGEHSPAFFSLICWCEALGVCLALQQSDAFALPLDPTKPSGVKKPSLKRLMAGR